jgi:hypothetical protein
MPIVGFADNPTYVGKDAEGCSAFAYSLRRSEHAKHIHRPLNKKVDEHAAFAYFYLVFIKPYSCVFLFKTYINKKPSELSGILSIEKFFVKISRSALLIFLSCPHTWASALPTYVGKCALRASSYEASKNRWKSATKPKWAVRKPSLLLLC